MWMSLAWKKPENPHWSMALHVKMLSRSDCDVWGHGDWTKIDADLRGQRCNKALVYRDVGKVVWSGDSSFVAVGESVCGTHREPDTGLNSWPVLRGVWWLCHAASTGQHFPGMGFSPLVPSETRVTANHYKVILSDHHHPVIKPFHPMGAELTMTASTAQELWSVWQWCALHSHHIWTLVLHLWENLDWDTHIISYCMCF